MDVQAVYERLADLDPGDLSPSERRLVALGELRADVNNGGFDQYFLNSAGDLVMEALDGAVSVGAGELASLIQRALDILDVNDPGDRDAREERLMTIDQEEFEALDQEYYAIEETTDLDEVMRQVLRSNQQR